MDSGVGFKMRLDYGLELILIILILHEYTVEI
jgi:hypothetical protein